MNYDVFNGDADGIIALLQLQLANPTPSKKITGVKRDIQLLKQVDAKAGDNIRVLDISMEKNIEALKRCLDAGAEVFYADHHRAGDIPSSDKLTAHIDLDANTCTSLIVSELLDKQFHLWAITAAYGDNMIAAANAEADKLGLSQEQKDKLKALGIYINYNGYGSEIEDLHFHPAALFELLLAYSSPLQLIEQKDSIFYQLEGLYIADMDKAQAAEVMFENNAVKVILLEDAPWARRVSGVLGNELANQSPEKAHAVLTHHKDSGYTVSIRAPLNNKQGADQVVTQFATGGGRAAAAGINQLAEVELERFYQVFGDYYS
ncbi:DHH family phosphoesterase [Pseudoalteromonas sp. G4]|uniref:DHH family phosphoesterase n=1 Tax=Pseudoalteromonas sp. G4 TaxID=2992761 RepID=UPI00237E574C|nr:DHH family phosphoesterase [Pseudoalteromonas sp. G4]MDE3271261.1 DHH family phosphoesterase [Pseudoalteromonas sp. G4]